MRPRASLVALAGVLALAASALDANQFAAVGQPSLARPAPMFTTGADLVVLHATVKRDGAYVTGLPASAFEIFDGGQRQAISVFMHDDVPVTLGVVIDSSGSMRDVRRRALFASTAFADEAHHEDELFGLAFNDGVMSALPEASPFTSSASALGDALSGLVVPRGRTALYDGIVAGLRYLERGRHARRVLVVVSDGGDNASRHTLDQVIAEAHASNAAIYTIGLAGALDVGGSRGALRRLARSTGGESHAPADHVAMRRAMRAIASDVRQAYTLGFVPLGVPRDGAVHRVEVRVRAPGGAVSIRARTGYLASAEPGAPGR